MATAKSDTPDQPARTTAPDRGGDLSDLNARIAAAAAAACRQAGG